MSNYFNLLIFLAALTSAVSAQTFQVINCDKAPTIDGKLTEAIWQQTPTIRQFYRLGSGLPVDNQCKVWLAADSEAIYVAVSCVEPFLPERLLKYSKKDEPVWQDDGIEIFLDPGRSKDSYAQIIINSAGVIMDGYCQSKTNSKLEVGWDSGAKVEVKTDQDGWNMEVRIPFAQLPIANPTADWGIHIARNQRGRSSEHLTCLQERIQGFNDLDRFAVLKGLDLSKLSISPLRLDFGECLLGQNSSTIVLKNWSQKEAKVEIAQNWQDKSLTPKKTVLVPPGEAVTVSNKWLLQPKDLGRTQEIEIYHQGDLLQRASRKITSIPEVFFDNRQRAFYRFADQPTILEIPIQLAEDTRMDAILEWSVSDQQGQKLCQGKSVLQQPTAVIRIYWTFAQDGDYLLDLHLHKDGQELGQVTRLLRLLSSPWQ